MGEILILGLLEPFIICSLFLSYASMRKGQHDVKRKNLY